MAEVYEITVHIRRNGQRLSGFPITRRCTVDRAMDSTREHADDAAELLQADYLLAWQSADASIQFTAPQFFFITSDQITRIQSKYGDAVAVDTYPIVIGAGGFLLAVGLDVSQDRNRVTNSGMGTCVNGTSSVERIIVGGDD